jgi:hypothetical protein
MHWRTRAGLIFTLDAIAFARVAPTWPLPWTVLFLAGFVFSACLWKMLK